MFRHQSALKYIRVPCAVYQIFGKFNKFTHGEKYCIRSSHNIFGKPE